VASCVSEIERRETRWCRLCFRLVPRGKIVISHIILLRMTVERTAVATCPSPTGTGRTPVMAEPLAGYGERGRVGPSHHPLPWSFLSLPLPPLLKTLAATNDLPVGLACRPTPSGPGRAEMDEFSLRSPARYRSSWESHGAMEDRTEQQRRLRRAAAPVVGTMPMS
jgi:hypothetical protein